MIQQFRHRQFPAGNPFASALVIVVGVLVIALSFVVGVVALVALIAAAVIVAAVTGMRIWWLNRRTGIRGKIRVNHSRRESSGSEVIEGEFRVVERGRETGPDAKS